MKKLIPIIAICCVALVAGAAEWLTDVPKALALAKANKKLVVLDFTGSDWCPPCKALHKNVLTSKEFEAYASTNLVLVELDYPHHKEQTEELKKANEALSDKYKIEAYPTLIVLDGDGNQLSKEVGYDPDKTTTKSLIAQLEKLKKK